MESRDRSVGKPTSPKPMSPKGDADVPGASPVAKDKGVALSPTPEDPPRSSSEHVSFTLVLLLLFLSISPYPSSPRVCGQLLVVGHRLKFL